MSGLNSLDPEQLSVLANIIAISLAKDRSSDEIDILGNLFSSVGDLLQLIAAQQENLESQKEKKEQIKDLKKQIKDLKNE